MADTLYLSLWYPNLRLESLGEKLCAVLSGFAAHGGEARVYAATVWPVNWSEAPVFQRIYGRMAGGGTANAQESSQSSPGADPRQAVEEALELLHDDFAYEFQIGWKLWELETDGESAAEKAERDGKGGLRPLRWARTARLVRVAGYGPLFDAGAYEQDGHIRIDFGSDAPFLEEEAELDRAGALHVEENVRQLVELATGVEKASGATARLLWSELGESLAERLAERLGRRN